MILRLMLCTILVLCATSAEAARQNPHNTLDCLFCHSEVPRFGVDTKDTVLFYRFEGDDPALCFVCHKPEENLHPLGVEPGKGDLGTKAPLYLPLGSSEEMAGQVVCTTCHFIHAADSNRALLRGFSGSQRPRLFLSWQDFCRHCHGEALEKRSPHSGDEQSCPTCHTVMPSEKERIEVMARGVELCNFCHGVMQDDHLDGVNPFEGEVNCLSCHGPHLKEAHPGRLKQEYYDFMRGAVTINPHGKKLLCSLCHVEDEKFTLVTRDKDALCNRCHATPKVVGEMHPLSSFGPEMTIPEGWPVFKEHLTCLTCHLPGHESERGIKHLLRGSPYESRNDFCRKCHDYEKFAFLNPHVQVAQLQGCDTCHDKTPIFGKDTAQSVTFKASVNILCLRCHEDTPHPGTAVHTTALTEERAAGIPEYYPLDKYNRLTCSSCHNPHLPEKANFKLRETISGMEICTDCHFL